MVTACGDHHGTSFVPLRYCFTNMHVCLQCSFSVVENTYLLSSHGEARDNILLTHLLRHRNVSNTNISGNEA